MILFLTNNQSLSILTILKRILLEIIAFKYYMLTMNFKSAIAVKMSSLWCIFNMKYLYKRRKNIKSKIDIPSELMVPYSIIKKYFLNKKHYYKDLNH